MIDSIKWRCITYLKNYCSSYLLCVKSCVYNIFWYTGHCLFLISAYYYLFFWLHFLLSIWASSWDYGTYHIGDQRRLRRACASAQSRQSVRCSHKWNMQASSPTGWLRMRVLWIGLRRTKNTIISWDCSFYFQNLAENDLGVTGTKHIVDIIKQLDSIHSLSLSGKNNWATSWQNQQNDCAPSEDRSAWASAQSDQSLRCALNGQLRTQCFFMRTAKTLIRLGGCPGWSESSLGAQSFYWFSRVASQLYT